MPATACHPVAGIDKRHLVVMLHSRTCADKVIKLGATQWSVARFGELGCPLPISRDTCSSESHGVSSRSELCISVVSPDPNDDKIGGFPTSYVY